jgi:hypothetical protein
MFPTAIRKDFQTINYSGVNDGTTPVLEQQFSGIRQLFQNNRVIPERRVIPEKLEETTRLRSLLK